MSTLLLAVNVVIITTEAVYVAGGTSRLARSFICGVACLVGLGVLLTQMLAN